jgi:hypothetical protein
MSIGTISMVGTARLTRRTIVCTGAGGRAGFKWRVITAGPVMRDVAADMASCHAAELEHRYPFDDDKP